MFDFSCKTIITERKKKTQHEQILSKSLTLVIDKMAVHSLLQSYSSGLRLRLRRVDILPIGVVEWKIDTFRWCDKEVSETVSQLRRPSRASVVGDMAYLTIAVFGVL